MTSTAHRLATRLIACVAARTATHTGRDDADRGDVPGWVLVTVMTAGLVVVLGAAAGEALTGLFESTLASVTP